MGAIALESLYSKRVEMSQYAHFQIPRDESRDEFLRLIRRNPHYES